MAVLTITMQREDAGRPVIRIALRSDIDTLPQEHEARHRRIVAQLLGSTGDVERERPAVEAAVG